VSAPILHALEHLDVFTPLGVRFWDSALDRPIEDGLRVVARPWHAIDREIAAYRSRSGVHTFRWLPGMRAIEYHQRPDPFFDGSIPGRRPFLVTVDDTRERFLPAAFRVELPLPYPGVFLAESGASAPDGSRRGVYLFSAPTRRVDEKLTAVRGSLAAEDTRAPVPWPHVIVRAPHGRIYHGLGDERGRFSVMFPYPSLEEGFQGSAGSFGFGTPIGERGWDITLEVRSQPGALRPLPGTALPEYRSIFNQADAELWSVAPDPSTVPEAQLSLRLPLGQQLTIRTRGLSEQLITPAPGSP
jgi:hypothetical protein